MRGKLIIAALVLALSGNAHAGFLAGVIVGSAASGGSSAAQQGTILGSDTHDVIVCCVASWAAGSNHQNLCKDADSNSRGIPPAQFAGNAGYKVLHKVGHVNNASTCDQIIMEVSK